MPKNGDASTLSGRIWEALPFFNYNGDLPFYKDSLSNIRLKTHLDWSSWDHRATITSISFHYCICWCKWHIYILSVWKLDKQLRKIRQGCQGSEALVLGVHNQHQHQAPTMLVSPVFLLPSFLPSFHTSAWQLRKLTAWLNSLNSDFSLRLKGWQMRFSLPLMSTSRKWHNGVISRPKTRKKMYWKLRRFMFLFLFHLHLSMVVTQKYKEE